MNREALKTAIKKIVLQEITSNTNTVGTTDTLPDDAAVDALKKAVKDAHVEKRPGSSKTTASGQKHQVAMSRNADDSFDVVSITNGSDRRTAKNLTLEAVGEFLKKHAKETETSYVQKAYDKSEKGFGIKPKKDEEKNVGVKVDETDKMEDAEEDKQVDIADDETKKADVKVETELAPVDDDLAPQMGGKLVDKIEKIIDRVLKSKTKADSKTAYLKADSDNESSDKLTVKVKETPALKGGK